MPAAETRSLEEANRGSLQEIRDDDTVLSISRHARFRACGTRAEGVDEEKRVVNAAAVNHAEAPILTRAAVEVIVHYVGEPLEHDVFLPGVWISSAARGVCG